MPALLPTACKAMPGNSCQAQQQQQLQQPGCQRRPAPAPLQRAAPPLSRARLLRAALLVAAGGGAALPASAAAGGPNSVLASDGLIDSLRTSLLPPEPVVFPRRQVFSFVVCILALH